MRVLSRSGCRRRDALSTIGQEAATKLMEPSCMAPPVFELNSVYIPRLSGSRPGMADPLQSDGTMVTPNTDSLRPDESQRIHAVRQAETSLFDPLEPREPRGYFFLASVGVHAALLIALLVVPLFLIEPVRPQRYDLTLLVPPAPRQVMEMPRLKVPEAVQPRPVIAPTQPKPSVFPVEPRVEVKEVKLPELKFDPKPVPEIQPPPERLPAAASLPKPVQPVVRTDVFSNSPETRPVPEPPARPVLTAGFGDSKDASSKDRANRAVAAVGSFGDGEDMNRGAGSKGERRIVSSGEFEGAKTTGPSASGRTLAASTGSSFTSYRPVNAQVRQRVVDSVQVPVEIIYKPRPEYTETGRRLRIEGDVRLRVLFPASGPVQVLEVIGGLGHGLDESAVRAAQQIQFKPALRDGSPVDSTATIRVAFQMAY